MKSKGFTLIELLVVIAIVGILASVVLVALNSARAKGADAAIKANLESIRVQAEMWYDDNGQKYAIDAFHQAGPPTTRCATTQPTGNILEDNVIWSAMTSAYKLVGDNHQCYAFVHVNEWAAAIQLKTSDGYSGSLPDAWCVDSAGNSKSYTYAMWETAPLTAINGTTGVCI